MRGWRGVPEIRPTPLLEGRSVRQVVHYANRSCCLVILCGAPPGHVGRCSAGSADWAAVVLKTVERVQSDEYVLDVLERKFLQPAAQ